MDHSIPTTADLNEARQLLAAPSAQPATQAVQRAGGSYHSYQSADVSQPWIGQPQDSWGTWQSAWTTNGPSSASRNPGNGGVE